MCALAVAFSPLGAGCAGDDIGAGDTMGGEVGDVVELDRIDPVCKSDRLPPVSSCEAAAVAQIPSRGARHVADGALGYVDSPPSSGDHRPAWARWGEYDYLPPQRWLHNLEHGGIAFLYDPCVDDGLVTQLRGLARAMDPDGDGAFRWVLTPYPNLPARVAAVAWEWTWQGACLDASATAAREAFVAEHYRKAPEDVAADGSYDVGWIGR